MQIGMSNIAWPSHLEHDCLKALNKNGVNCLEVAPTKYWSDIFSITSEQIDLKREELQALGFKIFSAQSLLFGRPDLKIFDPNVNLTIKYLKRMIDICSQLGTTVLVFGSPKNRLKEPRSRLQSIEEAAPIFRQLAEHAAKKEMHFCIEPNDPAYGCDFVTSVAEANELISFVNHANLGLNLDIGNMLMSGEKPAEAISSGLRYAKHLHISAPMLSPIYTLDGIITDSEWSSIRKFPYGISIEMLIKTPEDSVVSEVERSVNFLQNKLRY